VPYLTDFLFPAKRAMTPIAALSGGERNRVILAKLFTRAANLLVLDEPTNDFLDAIVTSTLVVEQDGQVRRHAGGYSDWLERHRALAVVDEPTAAAAAKEQRDTRERAPQRKLSYKLQRELDALPEQIARLEQKVAEIRAVVAEPSFYQQPHAEVQQALDELRDPEQRVETAVDRWAQLEEQAAAAASGGES
jgi:ATP-binding cassette subfamily F protein uup